MVKKVIVLNAPPYSGKDTLADLKIKNLKATKQEFKEPLYTATAKYYGLSVSYLKSISTTRKYKDNLTSRFSINHNITPRNALIHVSEDIIKPSKGASYFGELAAERLVEGLNVFADGGGWWDELLPVIQAADKLIICRLYRNGFNFDGDSRQYYDIPSAPYNSGIHISDIHLEENKPNIAIDAISQLL